MADEWILVVDDEPQVLMLMSRFLAHMNYHVATAEGGLAALECLKQRVSSPDGTYALVICDLKMPQVDGLAVLEQANQLSPDTLFVLVTGFATLDSAVTALRQGAYDYLTKPLDLDHLLLTVQRALDHRRLMLDNKRLLAYLQEQNIRLEAMHREEQRTSEQLRRVNAIAQQITTILDVQTLATSVVELMAPAFGFVAPSFGLVEEETLSFVSGQLAGQKLPLRESLFWRVTDGGRTWSVRTRKGADEESHDLVFPLRDGDQTVGFWVADWREDAEYRKENLPYLESLAAQTVAVLKNARLYAIARQADELAFLNVIAQAANQSLNLERTIRSILACVYAGFRASLVEVCLLDERKEILQVFSLLDGGFQQGQRPLLGEEFMLRVTEQPVIEHGTIRVEATLPRAAGEAGAATLPAFPNPWRSSRSDFLLAGMGQQATPGEEKASPDRTPGTLDLGSLVGVPLSFGAQQVGVLGVASTSPDVYDAESGRLLQVVAGQVATAMENARLFEEVVLGRRTILESRNTLQALFDGILEGIYIVDQDERILAINRTQAGWAGKDVAALIGQLADQAFPSSSCALELIRDTFRTGRTASRAERQHTEGGQWTEWEIRTYPVARSDSPAVTVGRLLPRTERVVAVVRDVTEQRWLEMSLLQSEKLAAVGTLAAGIAHEINNPMTVILANAQILREELSSTHPYYGSAELIDRAAERATKIVRNLLDLSRPEEFEFMPTDTNLSLQEALSLVEPQLRSADIEVVYELDPDLPPIWASPDHLQVVWLNLLLNARDAVLETGRGGRIELASRCRGDWITVRVADNGIGIPSDQIAHIYDPFFTTKGPGKGTGLGLFTCYRTVIRHGGEISVDSRMGEGTAFHVSLPTRRELVPGA